MDYFDYSNTSGFDVDAFLQQSQEREEKRLEEELDRIEQQLERRDSIHDEVIEELESKLDWYIERLEMLYKRRQGKFGERDEMKERIEEFYHEIRGKKQQHWQDRQQLERERRELIREITEAQDTDLLFELL